MSGLKLDTVLKPWELYADENFNPTEEQIVESWAKFEPKDFYFAYIEHDSHCCIVYLAPKEYFRLYKGSFPDSMAITHILPDYVIETFEGMYEANKNQFYVIQDMAMRGFNWNNHFQKWVDEHLNAAEYCDR